MGFCKSSVPQNPEFVRSPRVETADYCKLPYISSGIQT